MTPPIRIGVVGCGSVLRGGYLPIARRLCAEGLAELRAACDTRPELETEALTGLGFARFTPDYRALVSAPDIDLVLVLTPPAYHEEVARAAMLSGKHVLVEKPMALTLPGAAALVELARRSTRFLLCAPYVALSQTYRQIAALLKQGEIGPVYSARGICGHGGPDWSAWFYQPGGGGPLFDLAVYNVTTLTGWLGPVQRVTALTGIAISERVIAGQPVTVTAEDNAQLLLEFASGALAVVTSSFTIQAYRDATLELYGARGTLRMQGDDWAPNGYEIWTNETRAWETVPERDPGWDYLSGLAHLVECIQAGQSPAIDPLQAYHVLEVLLKAQEAARTGTVQVVESRFD